MQPAKVNSPPTAGAFISARVCAGPRPKPLLSGIGWRETGGCGVEKSSLKKQAMVTAGSTAAVRAAGFALRLWISRLLGAEALGILELASGVHMLALTPAAAGLPGAVSRMAAKAENEEQRQLALYAGRQVSLRLGGVIAPLFFLLGPLLSRALGDERALPALWCFVPCVITVGVSSVYDGWFFGRGRALPPAVSECAEQAARMLALAALARWISRVTPAWRAAMPAAASTVGEAVGLGVVMAWAGRVPSFRHDPRLAETRRQLMGLSLPLLLNRLCHTGLRSLCSAVIPLRLMAGGCLRAEAMSLLGMLNGMVMPLMFLPCMVSGALAAVGAPAAARCKTAPAERRLIRRLLFAALAVGAACAGGLYALAPFLARRFYRLPELTALIRFSCPLALLLPLHQAASGVMTGLGMQKKTLRASLAGSAVLLFFTWYWVPKLGISGAALSSMIGHAVMLLCDLFWLHTKI